MHPVRLQIAVLLLATLWQFPLFAVPQIAIPEVNPSPAEPHGKSLLNRPTREGVVVVRAAFHLLDIDAIDEELEAFEFSGVLTLKWQDARQAFDADEEGTDEKVYQGDYQVKQFAPTWYPQVLLTNAAGSYEKSAVLLRVQPDGHCTLVESVSAIAESKLQLRLAPFDSQQLEAVFEIFGFDTRQVILEADPMPERASEATTNDPQWTVNRVASTIRKVRAPYTAQGQDSSALVLRIQVTRQPIYNLRLVVFPLTLIVALSWSVFWMDRSSLGDRMSVSFVGILTAVTYQLVQGGIMPKISYLTLMNGFLNVSFLVTCASVVVNLVVGTADRRGDRELGDRIDRVCRWAFPGVYFGISISAFAIAYFWPQ